MNIVGCIPRFLKAHGGWVLTGLSVLGLTGTAVLTAKAAPKAHQALQEAKDDKIVEWIDGLPDEEYRRITSEAGMMDDFPKEAELTFIEKFDAVAPHYIPAFLCYIVTAGCMIGAQIFNMKQQAAILAAYGLLVQEFNEYRGEVRKDIGEERERQIFNANHQKMIELQKENQRLRDENGYQVYMLSMLPNVTFELRPGQLDKALYEFYRNMNIRGGGPLAEFYEFIGIPKSAWGEEYKNEAEEYGWEMYENECCWGSSWVDFVVRQIRLKNENVINVICPTIPPYRLGLDYGSTDSSCDNLYRNSYVIFDDIERWLNSVEGMATVKTTPIENTF